MGLETARPYYGLRLAELLAAVSLATDLAHDVPAESALRDAVLAVEFARRIGTSGPELSDVFYLALLYHIGCTGAVAAQSRLGAGDDRNVRRWMSEADYANRPGLMRVAVTKLAPQWGATGLVQGIAALATAGRDLPEAFANIAEVAARLSQRLGASPGVTESLCHAYGRWDGKIFPSLPSGAGLSRTARLVHLVHIAQIYHQVGGLDAADAVVRQRSGSELDPELARLWLENAADLFGVLSGESTWDQVLEAEPEPHRRVGQAHLDDVSAALADFVDLASPFTSGHSTHVARLAEGGSVARGVGRGGGGNRSASWTDPRPRHAQRSKPGVGEARSAQSGRVGARPAASISQPAHPRFRRASSRGSGDRAGLHHERLDGSGYHRGLTAKAVPLSARILAVAEMHQSMSEERAWRPALTPRPRRRANCATTSRREPSTPARSTRYCRSRRAAARWTVSEGVALRPHRPRGGRPAGDHAGAVQQADRPGSSTSPKRQCTRTSSMYTARSGSTQGRARRCSPSSTTSSIRQSMGNRPNG